MTKTLVVIALILSIASCQDDGGPTPDTTTSSEAVSAEPSEATLFLTSSGMGVSSKLIPMLPFKPTGKTVHYVTTAAHFGGVPEWMDDEIEAIEDIGFRVIRIDLAALTPEDLESAFSGCDLFWVGGGNTLYLLQEVRRSGFDRFLTRKISEGVPYVGVSAGAIILGPDIEFELLASQSPELTSYEGLNLFPFAPYVHFDDPVFRDVYREILNFSLDQSSSFITLKDNQFIYVKGDKWQVIDV